MQQQRQRNKVILGVLALGLLAGVALTAHPAQAVDAPGPYYALPSWDRKMGVVNRFVVLTNWASAAVLDKETGLVWERSPDSANTFSWFAARGHCMARTTGNHKGWRMPSVHELASVIDPSVAFPGPALPVGHPFLTVQSAPYWTATTNAGFPDIAWYVHFNNGGVSTGAKSSGTGLAWCVRGGMNADVY
jgi:hypothetical protein